MGMTKTSAHRRPFTPLPTLGRDAAKVSNEPRLTDAAGRANVGFRPARRTMMELVSFHQVTPGIADDHPRRMQEKPRDRERDDQVGPCTAKPRDQPGGDDHGEVADGVVARKQPDGPHVGIALAVLQPPNAVNPSLRNAQNTSTIRCLLFIEF